MAMRNSGAAGQFYDVSQQEIRGRRIDAQHGELVDVARGHWPQPRRVGRDALGPGRVLEGHQRPVTLFRPRIATLALAGVMCYQSLMDSGKFESRAALARYLGVRRPRVTQVLRRLS